jgi:hypothetical protein
MQQAKLLHAATTPTNLSHDARNSLPLETYNGAYMTTCRHTHFVAAPSLVCVLLATSQKAQHQNDVRFALQQAAGWSGSHTCEYTCKQL